MHRRHRVLEVARKLVLVDAAEEQDGVLLRVVLVGELKVLDRGLRDAPVEVEHIPDLMGARMDAMDVWMRSVDQSVDQYTEKVGTQIPIIAIDIGI